MCMSAFADAFSINIPRAKLATICKLIIYKNTKSVKPPLQLYNFCKISLYTSFFYNPAAGHDKG